MRTKERAQFRFSQGYGDQKIVILVRDPWWIFAYWEIRREREKEIIGKIESDGDSPVKTILRVYDVTDINFTALSLFVISLDNTTPYDGKIFQFLKNVVRATLIQADPTITDVNVKIGY